MENARPLQEVAKALGVTDNQVRYWLKIMGEQPLREGKLRFVNPETESRIQEMVGLIRQGTPPKEAAAKVKVSPTDTAIIPQEKDDPLEEVRKVLLLLVEENRQMKGHLVNMGKEVSALREENSSLRGLLQPPAGSPPVISSPARETTLKNYPVPARREPVQESGFIKELREVQAWIAGLFSPFTEVFRGS